MKVYNKAMVRTTEQIAGLQLRQSAGAYSWPGDNIDTSKLDSVATLLAFIHFLFTSCLEQVSLRRNGPLSGWWFSLACFAMISTILDSVSPVPHSLFQGLSPFAIDA